MDHRNHGISALTFVYQSFGVNVAFARISLRTRKTCDNIFEIHIFSIFSITFKCDLSRQQKVWAILAVRYKYLIPHHQPNMKLITSMDLNLACMLANPSNVKFARKASLQNGTANSTPSATRKKAAALQLSWTLIPQTHRLHCQDLECESWPLSQWVLTGRKQKKYSKK